MCSEHVVKGMVWPEKEKVIWLRVEYKEIQKQTLLKRSRASGDQFKRELMKHWSVSKRIEFGCEGLQEEPRWLVVVVDWSIENERSIS